MCPYLPSLYPYRDQKYNIFTLSNIYPVINSMLNRAIVLLIFRGDWSILIKLNCFVLFERRPLPRASVSLGQHLKYTQGRSLKPLSWNVYVNFTYKVGVSSLFWFTRINSFILQKSLTFQVFCYWKFKWKENETSHFTRVIHPNMYGEEG